ncbi:FAS1-like dehydratase domain-containing protein [Neobacillus sp. LXY-4]|uniref:FAS1-like dehydratase domain-containing protein n=1 Tax=Neobacillus sp. LXY-4 TaxID=3379826 RepID=UPI003EDF89F8
MRTKDYTIIFREGDVRQFIKVIDDRNPIYESIATAQSYDYTTIPLPPTMPMIAYKWIDIPWTLTDPIIHRTQNCRLHSIMYIDEPYTANVSISYRTRREDQCLVKQTLLIKDRDGNICFEGISQLMAGGLI